MAALAVRNGPMKRPCLKSSSASSISRSIAIFGVRVIVLPRTWASRRSPTATPAFLRTDAGSVTWYFSLILTSGTADPPIQFGMR